MEFYQMVLAAGGISAAINGIIQLAIKLFDPARKHLKDKQETDEALKEGLKVLLWFRLDKDAYAALDRGYTTRVELDRISDEYDAYHALGGNGTGTALFEAVKRLPTRSDYKTEDIRR